MTGANAYDLLRGIALSVRGRSAVEGDELVLMLRQALGTAPLTTAQRSKRYRDEKKRQSDAPSRNPVTHVTSIRDEQHEASRISVTAEPPSLGFPLASPSGSLPPSDPKEIAAGSEGSDRLPAKEQAAAAAKRLTTGSVGETGIPRGNIPSDAPQPTEPGRIWSKRPPTNSDEAREMPLQERAELVLRDPFRAQFIEPHRWPEVRFAVVAFREAVKKPRLAVGTFATDLGVRRLCELYAAGLTADEVCAAIPLVVASPWWTSGESARDLGSLSLTVVRRALAERKPPATDELAALPRQMFGK